MKKVGILSYGTGNVLAFANAFKRLGLEAFIISDYADIPSCSHLVLPGVGSFDDVITSLDGANFTEPIKEHILNKNRPFLSVCSGSQVLFSSSEESNTNSNGLGVLPGSVIHLSSSTIKPIVTPHLGWNTVRSHNSSDPLLINNLEFYFLHSYVLKPKFTPQCCYLASYSCVQVPALIYHENVLACQFHPEKSHSAGSKVLDFFLRT